MPLSKFALITFLFYSLSLSLLLPRGNAAIDLPPLKQIGKQGSGILKVPLSIASPGTLSKRQDSSGLLNVINGYLITSSIGTPPQLVYTQIDTGSSDLWVNPICANANDPSYCASFPVYYPGNSSTDSDTGSPLSITYGTGSVTGQYLTDNVILGNAKILKQQFGWAKKSTFPNNGIMGLGLGYGWTLNYNNVIDQLYVQGFTHSRAFSLDLASIDVAEGSVIFGGIDTMKYIGSLYKSPMIPYYNAPDRFPRYWFYMTSVGISKPGASTSTLVTASTLKQAVFPDSGSTLSQLPPNLFNLLISFFPTAVNIGNGVYTVDCSIRNQAGTIDFGFGTKIIKVSYHEWFWQAGSTCYFGAVANANTWSLGDSFLRSAYVVFDQDNFNVHIAQAANCGTNVVTIGSGVNAVPSIVGACPSSSQISSSTTTSKTVSSLTTSLKTSTSSSSLKPSSSTVSSKTTTSSSSATTSKSVSSSTASSKTSTSSNSSKSPSSTVPSKASASSSSTTSSKNVLSSSSLQKTSSSSSTLNSSSSQSSKTSTSSSTTTSRPVSSSTNSSSKSSSTGSTSKTSSSTSSTSAKPSSTSVAAKSSSKTSSSLSNSSTFSSTSSTSASASKTTTFPTATVYITVMHTGTCSAVGQVY